MRGARSRAEGRWKFACRGGAQSTNWQHARRGGISRRGSAHRVEIMGIGLGGLRPGEWTPCDAAEMDIVRECLDAPGTETAKRDDDGAWPKRTRGPREGSRVTRGVSRVRIVSRAQRRERIRFRASAPTSARSFHRLASSRVELEGSLALERHVADGGGKSEPRPMGISSVNAPLRISNSPDASVAAFAAVFSLSFASAPSGRGTVPTTETASPPFAARSALTSASGHLPDRRDARPWIRSSRTPWGETRHFRTLDVDRDDVLSARGLPVRGVALHGVLDVRGEGHVADDDAPRRLGQRGASVPSGTSWRLSK